MLGAPSTEVTPGHTTPHTPQSPAVSAKASPRPYQLQEKLVTINEIPSWEPPSTGSVNSGVATPLSVLLALLGAQHEVPIPILANQ